MAESTFMPTADWPSKVVEVFQPLGDRVLVRRAPVKTHWKGGIEIPEQYQNRPDEGEVIAVGMLRANVIGGGYQTLGVGDHVLFGKYGGQDILVNDEPFVILRYEEILGILRKETVALTSAEYQAMRDEQEMRASKKCDGQHAPPECEDKECWLKGDEMEEVKFDPEFGQGETEGETDLPPGEKNEPPPPMPPMPSIDNLCPRRCPIHRLVCGLLLGPNREAHPGDHVCPDCDKEDEKAEMDFDITDKDLEE